MLKRHTSSQSGQVGIILVLLMISVLTVGLSLSSRASSELALSQQEQESTRVFTAAEAGVEQALNTDFRALTGDTQGTTTVPGSSATVNYSVTRVRSLDTRLLEGMSAKVQLSDASTAPPNSVRVSWGKESNCSQDPASLVISIYSQNLGSTTPITVRHLAFTANGCSRGDGVPGSSAGSGGFLSQQDIPLNRSDYFMRVKSVYNDTNLRVAATAGTLPIQGYAIRSTATSTIGNENRNVDVNRSLPTAPAVMDYALISGTLINK